MPLSFVVEHFTLERVVKGPAGLDPDKLLAYQEHWMGRLSLEQKVAGCLPYLVRAGFVNEPVSEEQREFVGRLVAALGERIKLFSDIIGYEEYFVADDQLAHDEKTFDKRLRKADGSTALLRQYRDALQRSQAFDAPSVEALTTEFLTARGIGLGEIVHALRVAVTGKPAGPGMFDCLALLGCERCVARIDRALQRL
jgi:glutamyl-tRNA synthetase